MRPGHDPAGDEHYRRMAGDRSGDRAKQRPSGSRTGKRNAAPLIVGYRKTQCSGYHGAVKLTIELDREEDGRWIAEALELPGVMCYGQTRDEAISNAERLAIEVIADRIAHGEMASAALAVSFSIPDEQLASH